MARMQQALKRRIVPSFPLALNLTDDDGTKQTLNFRLSFDYNAFALIQDRTGLEMATGDVWRNLRGSVLSVVFWAALLAHHQEYRGDEGLEVIRSYMDAGNTDQITEAILDAYIASLPEEKQAPIRELKERALHGDPTKPGPETPGPAKTNP